MDISDTHTHTKKRYWALNSSSVGVAYPAITSDPLHWIFSIRAATFQITHPQNGLLSNPSMQKQSIQEKLRMFQKANRKTWTEVCQTGQEARRNGKKKKKNLCALRQGCMPDSESCRCRFQKVPGTSGGNCSVSSKSSHMNTFSPSPHDIKTPISFYRCSNSKEKKISCWRSEKS